MAVLLRRAWKYKKKDDTVNEKPKAKTEIRNGYVTQVFTQEELKAQRAEVLAETLKLVKDKTVKINGIDKSIKFSGRGLRDAINMPNDYIIEKNEAVRNILELLPKGKYIGSGPDFKNNPMVKQYHYAQIELSNKAPVYAVIREYKNGDIFFYSISHEKNE